MVRLFKLIVVNAITMFVVVAAGCLLGCNDASKVECSQFKQWTENQERANDALERSTSAVLDDFKAELYRPSRREAALFWMGNAEEIVGISKSINHFIDSLKRSIQQQEMANSYPAKAEMAGDEILVTQKNGHRLFDSLLNYRRLLFKVDTSVERTFKSNRQYMDSFFLSGCNNAEEFASKMFANRSNSEVMFVLENLKCEVLNCENDLVTFCWGKLPKILHELQCIQPMSNQNSKRFNPGDELEIQLAMGYFSAAYDSKFFIDGVQVKVGDGGIAAYKKRVQTKPGKYTIPVIIESIKPDGTLDKLEKTIEYTVVE